jgi:transcriptional regulator with XRE-family HTH domain
MLRVQEICKEKGMSMQDLAKRMGITYQALYASISGNPTIGKIKEIAAALGVDYLELLEDRSNVKIILEYRGESKRITESDIIKLFKEK